METDFQKVANRVSLITIIGHVIEGYDHGELSIGNPMNHVKMLKMWIGYEDPFCINIKSSSTK